MVYYIAYIFNYHSRRGAAIAQWIRLCHHPVAPGSSPNHIF